MRGFDGIYPELAKKHGLILYPFFLDGVALNGDLNLGDGIHPNPKGVAEITKRILPTVEELIARVRARQTAGSEGISACRVCSRRSKYRRCCARGSR